MCGPPSNQTEQSAPPSLPGGAALAIAAVGLAFTPWFPQSGLETVVGIGAVAAGVFGMWRVWRDEHTYGY